MGAYDIEGGAAALASDEGVEPGERKEDAAFALDLGERFQIETGVRPTARRRRVIAVMRLPRREDFNPQLKGEAK